MVFLLVSHTKRGGETEQTGTDSKKRRATPVSPRFGFVYRVLGLFEVSFFLSVG